MASLALQRWRERLEDRTFIWHDSNPWCYCCYCYDEQQLFYSVAGLRRTRQTRLEYPRGTVHVRYLDLYHYSTCIHFTAGQAEKGRIKSWLVLYMAPHSEWTGCGSGITKNCEWLTPKKERQQILTGRNNGSTAGKEEKESLQQETEQKLLPPKTMLYRQITMRTPPYVRSLAKNPNARTRTIPSGYDNPPVHAAKD